MREERGRASPRPRPRSSGSPGPEGRALHLGDETQGGEVDPEPGRAVYNVEKA